MITDLDVYGYTLPLADPVFLEGEEVTHRRGLFVRLTGTSGGVGWGEAAPLAGFSAESLTAVVRFVQTSLAGAITDLDVQPSDVSQALDVLDFPSDCPASLRFAVEGALVDLISTELRTMLPNALGAARQRVSVNGLIGDPLRDGEERAERLAAQGYSTIKVKVGRVSIPEEARAVRRISEALSDEITIRLDANRAWSYAEALDFAAAIDDVSVEYVEEPLSSPERLDDLAEEMDLPIALDETTRDVSPHRLRAVSYVVAVVLKPTLLGGVQKTRAWMRAVQEVGADPVISAAYESGVGFGLLVALAATGPPVCSGLSTYDRLARDVLSPRPAFEGPSINIRDVVHPDSRIDVESLRPIPLDG